MTGDEETTPGPGGRPRRRREPATLDLTARTIAEDAPAAPAPEGEAPAAVETPATAPAGSAPSVPQQALAPDDAAASSGHGAESSATLPEAAAGEPSAPQEPAPDSAVASTEPAESERSAGAAAAADSPAAESPSTSVPPAGRRARTRGAGAPAMIAAGVGGGLLGALLVAGGFLVFGPDIAERFAAVETRLGTKASVDAVQALDKRIGGNEAALKSVEGQVEVLGKRPVVAPRDVATLGERVGQAEQRIGALEARPAPTPDEGAAASAPPPPAPPPAPVPVVGSRESAVLSVAMLLRDALDSGRAYDRELDALKRAGVEPAIVSALEPYARTGAPSGPALAAKFEPLHVRLSEPPSPSGEAGFADRVRHGLSRIFKVRRSGEVSGDDPASIAARAQAQLGRGQFSAALATLESLPEPQRGETRAFAEEVRRRMAAGQAVDVLLSQAVDRLLAVTSSTGGAAQ